MCGIIGCANGEGLPWSIDSLNAARDTLAHRGPDSAGSWSDSQVYLGFRRLAILDLSPSADQPMQDNLKELVIVFNGEIYNYRQLKQDRELAG